MEVAQASGLAKTAWVIPLPIGYQISDIRYQMLAVRYQISDIRCSNTVFEYSVFVFEYLYSNTGISDTSIEYESTSTRYHYQVVIFINYYY